MSQVELPTRACECEPEDQEDTWDATDIIWQGEGGRHTMRNPTYGLHKRHLWARHQEALSRK